MTVVYLRPPLGQGGRVPRWRRRAVALSLTPEETTRLRAALRNLRRLYGTWKALAAAMGVATNTIAKVAQGKTPGSPALVLRAARVANLPVDRILTSGLVSTDRCAACGRPL